MFVQIGQPIATAAFTKPFKQSLTPAADAVRSAVRVQVLFSELQLSTGQRADRSHITAGSWRRKSQIGGIYTHVIQVFFFIQVIIDSVAIGRVEHQVVGRVYGSSDISSVRIRLFGRKIKFKGLD